MGRPRHAATPVRRRPGIRLDRLPRTAVPAAAVVALAAALALVVPALARAGQPAPVALSAVPLSVPADPAGDPAPDPLAEPPGEDWAADAAIRAAVVVQQAERRAAVRAAARSERAAGRRAAVADTPPAVRTRPVGAPDAPVWIVGDSIGSGLGAAWGGPARVVADPGARTAVIVPQLLSALRGTATTPALVVAAGTNDDPRDPAAFAAAVRQVLRATPGCVVWVTIHRPGERWEPLNAALRVEQARASGRLQLADWDALATANPSMLQPDGIHPRTGTVYASIASLARTALGRCA